MNESQLEFKWSFSFEDILIFHIIHIKLHSSFQETL